MEPKIVAFTVVSIAGTVLFFAFFGWQSWRRRRVHPALWISIAALTIFWLEGPYDEAGYCQFHPDNWAFPEEGWGPLSASHGGLPVVMPGAYVVYFVGAALCAAALAGRLHRRFGWNRVYTLLGTGLGLGLVWDASVNTTGAALGLWRFGRGAPGLVLFPGEVYQFPLYLSLNMAVMIMVATYLLGRTDDGGRAMLHGWATRRAGSGPASVALTLGATILVVQVVYAATYLPLRITYEAELQTTVADGQLFDDIENQPE